ncbi:MAG: PAS domain S-box protein, partial [Candidatus Gastranaerophilales bacterium]|nr:PAS domain S-box protein [Candidatus Gastranaerophilales bacterium]
MIIKFPFKSSIKAKFITTFLVIAVLISLIYFVTFMAFRQSISEYEQIIKNADMANRIPVIYKSLIDDDFKNYLVEAHQEFDKFQSKVAEIGKSVLYIKANTKKEHRDSISQLTGINNQLEIIKSKTTRAIIYRRNGDLDNANKEFYELGKLSEYLRENINQYISRELSHSIALREQIYRKSVIMGVTSAFLIILITVIGLIYGIKLSQSTAKALLQIASQDDIADAEEHTPYGEEELDQLYARFAQMQKNIKDYITQLSMSEKRLSTILNEMNDCVIITDINGVIEYINPAVVKIFDYQTDEVILQNIKKLVPDIEIRDGSYFLSSETSNAAAFLIDGKLQHNATKKNKQIFPVEIGINKTNIEDKVFFIVVIHDITEHKEVEKIKDEFISVVSHELRTPLTSIKGGLEFTLSGALGALPE